MIKPSRRSRKREKRARHLKIVVVGAAADPFFLEREEGKGVHASFFFSSSVHRGSGGDNNNKFKK